MESKKYYLTKYSIKVRHENHIRSFNDVIDVSISDWWLSVLKYYENDKDYFDPIIDFFVEINKEDFDKLNTIWE